MSIWRSQEQKQAVLEAARARGMIAPEQPVKSSILPTQPPRGAIASPKSAIAPGSGDLAAPAPAGKKRPIRRSPDPKTRPEREMALILEAQRRRGEIAGWIFEGATLLIGDGLRHTPDFLIWLPDGRIRFVETKGGYIQRHGLQAHQAARTRFAFAEWELWQLAKGGWSRLL